MAWHSGKPADSDFLSASVQYIRENFAELEPLQPHVAALLSSRIVEMGSNANGQYVRWENGLQVCWHGMNIGSPNAWGASYTSGEWTLPAEFADNQYARFATAGQSESGADSVTGRLNAGMARQISSTSSSCRWSVRSNGAEGSTGVWIFLLAIGRWK